MRQATYWLVLVVIMVGVVIAAASFSAAATDAVTLQQLSNDLAAVTDQARSVVVNIATSRTIKTPRFPFSDDPIVQRFFGTPGPRKAISLGSGVIVSTDGYIVTCNHVIESADDILINTADNKEYKARVVGSDAKTDIAILKIDESNLPAISFGDSDSLRAGEIVLALGNPYGLHHTVTMGIISGLKRSGMGVTEYEDFIQTDAAINPGNSGGPLLNSKGELIGINDFIFSTSGGSQGIGFAIPAKMVRAVMDSMLTKGKVVRGYLGVSIQPLTADLVRQFNLTDKNGALIVDITEGGPAEKAGLKVGDVITAYDNRKIESMQELKNWVASTPPGKQVSIRISRDGKVLTKVVTMGESASQSSPATAVERQSAVPSAPKIVDNNLKGVSVRDVTDDILQRLGVKRKLRGVVITTISEDSPALGTLERGDIIIEMNRKPIQSTADFNQVASGIGKGQDILLLIVRGGASQYLTISTR